MKVFDVLGAPVQLLGLLFYLFITVPWNKGKSSGYKYIVNKLYKEGENN